jgi:toxin YoeB
MGKYFIDLKETAKIEISKIEKSGDKATIKRLNKIILELSEHPTTGTGNPRAIKTQFIRFLEQTHQ